MLDLQIKNLSDKMKGRKLQTDGGGFWSIHKADVGILKVVVDVWPSCNSGLDDDEVSDEDKLLIGEMGVFFNPLDWDCEKHGLIYTDDLWQAQLRKTLIDIGFSEEAAKNVMYSEHGMQGDDYVSLDVGEKFLKELKFFL